MVTERAPFARVGSRFVADFEDLVAWLASRTDKTSVTRLCRIDWRTVGAIVARVVDDELDPARLDGLYGIGIDEVAYRYVGDQRTPRPSGSHTADHVGNRRPAVWPSAVSDYRHITGRSRRRRCRTARPAVRGPISRRSRG
ncbi:MAG: helix-turn-helix domain-containing protein [Egibacteraceae bacterium]